MFDLQVWTFETSDNILKCAATTGVRVQGIRKLVQRFLLLLLTDRGSVRYGRPRQQARGTTFLSQFREGYNTEADLMAAFDVATFIVKSQLREEESPDDDDSEMLKTAKLEKLILTPKAANLIIRIQSMTDEMRFVLPLATA